MSRSIVINKKMISIVSIFVVYCTLSVLKSSLANITVQSVENRESLFHDTYHVTNVSQRSSDSRDYRDTATRITSSWTNNSFIRVAGVTKVQNAYTTSPRGGRSSHLHLEFINCSNRLVRHHVSDREGSIRWSIHLRDFHKFSPANFPFCAVELSVPQGRVARVQVNQTAVNCNMFNMTLYDEDNEILFSQCPTYLPHRFETYSSHVTFNITVLNIVHSSFEAFFNITTIPKSSGQNLEINLNSSTSGQIQMKAWGNDGLYLPFIKTSVRLTAPDDHMVVLHLHIVRDICTNNLDRSRDHVTFRSDNNMLTYKMCELPQNSCTALAFYSGWVDINYRSYTTLRRKDFTVTFSFQHISQPPVQLSQDKWNCSRAHWPDMRQDAPCILLFDCNDDEGEGGCWQGDGTLKNGIFQVDGQCFAISHATERSTWNLESKWCRQRGGQLASLKTKTLRKKMAVLFSKLKENVLTFLGLKTIPYTLNKIYRHRLQWSDKTVAYTLGTAPTQGIERCYCFSVDRTRDETISPMLLFMDCNRDMSIQYHICQIPGSPRDARPPVISTTHVTDRLSQPVYIRCPAAHFTHLFQACYDVIGCWSVNDDTTSSCSMALTPLPPLFKCSEVQQSVPYTLVCDHRPDCKDGSDEDFCYFPPCDIRSRAVCSEKRCLQQLERCNNQLECDNQVDRDWCPKENAGGDYILQHFDVTVSVALEVYHGVLEMFYYNTSFTNSCPDTHFECANLHQVFLPVYLRCNGLYDCPDYEDEAECDRYTCPGFYRCRGSQVCVHERHVCDGEYQCPQEDDELFCNETCPHRCICHGWAFACSNNFSAASYSSLRYLDASETSMTLADLWNNTFLVHLILVRCNLAKLHHVTLPNLRILDLSNNELTYISSIHFTSLTNLEFLNVSNNPLKSFHFYNFSQPSPLKFLDMTEVRISEIDFGIFAFFSSLRMLNLSGGDLEHVTNQGFYGMRDLRILDLRGSPITIFPPKIFQTLDKLETIFADNYKLCCPMTLPRGFNVLNCHAPSNEVSSCDDLLRSNLYRVALAIFASLALLGNLVSLVYRLILHKTPGNVGYDVFVTNLCVADFLMGVYLLIIGIVDYRYRGEYLWEDVDWRNSGVCKMAGFICLLSCEVSVFVIFLITFDRFLVVRFPLSHIHFGKGSAQLTCAVTWLTGLVLAAVPLNPMTSHWQFYSQSSICIPLPTSRKYFPGRMYSLGVLVFLNFVFFLLIFIGQILIYWSVRANSVSAAHSSKTVKDFDIAKRLITVAMSDFLCWFPVGLGGILAFYDVPIPGEVNVGIAIFVLPVNAALNPYLYTINIYLERRRRRREEERRKRVVALLTCANGAATCGDSKLSSNDVVTIVKLLLSRKDLSLDDLSIILRQAK